MLNSILIKKFLNKKIYNTGGDSIYLAGIVTPFNTLVFVKSESDRSGITLLHKIMSAVKLAVEDYHVLDVALEKELGFQKIIEKRAIENIVCFDVLPRDLKLNMNPILNQVITLPDSNFLFTHSLDSIEKDKSKKAVLWACLQKMYRLK